MPSSHIDHTQALGAAVSVRRLLDEAARQCTSEATRWQGGHGDPQQLGLMLHQMASILVTASARVMVLEALAVAPLSVGLVSGLLGGVVGALVVLLLG